MNRMRAMLQSIAIGALLSVAAATAEASCRQVGNDVWCTVCSYQPSTQTVNCCVSVFQDGQCCDPIYVTCTNDS